MINPPCYKPNGVKSENVAERLSLALRSCELAPAQVAFDLEATCPEVFAEFLRLSPAIVPVLRTLATRMPIPQRSHIETGDCFYRLADHNRSFCYSVEGGRNVLCSEAIVFKGMEPVFADFDGVINWMCLTPFRESSLVMADHFPLVEGRIPGGVSLGEAIQEAGIAAELQLAHLHHYGELARLPVPLFVYRIPVDLVEACVRLLRQKLAPKTFVSIETLLESGLGVYVYYYPNAPVRASAYGMAASHNLAEFIEVVCCPETTVSRWICLFARLMHLGYLPYTPRSRLSGACMDFGNAVLDGGFCDVDSVEPISACPDDEFFFESLIEGVGILQATVGRVALQGSGLEKNYLYPHIEEFALSRYVCERLQQAIQSESRPTLRLDARATAILSPTSFSDVQRLLERKARPYRLATYLRHQTRR